MKELCQKLVCMMCVIVICKEMNGYKIESVDIVVNFKRQIIRDQKVKMEDVGKQI